MYKASTDLQQCVLLTLMFSLGDTLATTVSLEAQAENLQPPFLAV